LFHLYHGTYGECGSSGSGKAEGLADGEWATIGLRRKILVLPLATATAAGHYGLAAPVRGREEEVTCNGVTAAEPALAKAAGSSIVRWISDSHPRGNDI
jgi:hypothetical protein